MMMSDTIHVTIPMPQIAYIYFSQSIIHEKFGDFQYILKEALISRIISFASWDEVTPVAQAVLRSLGYEPPPEETGLRESVRYWRYMQPIKDLLDR
jgi:hypothetical protein